MQHSMMSSLVCYLSLLCVVLFPFFLQKDYGGPLVCQEHERKVIVGVSIQRTKCASSQPALFVNVAFYTEWIYKVFKLYPSLERNWCCGVKMNSMHDFTTAYKRRGGFRPANSKTSPAWTTGEKWGKITLWKVVHFGILWLNLLFYRDDRD